MTPEEFEAAGGADYYREQISKHGVPQEVLVEDGGFMIVLLYPNKAICCGYDDNEYSHTFVFSRSSALASERSREVEHGPIKKDAL